MLKQRLVAGAAIIAALIGGWQIAQGSLGLMAVLCGAGVLLIATTWLRVHPDALIAGIVIIGYLVGNRGFAQLHPPNLPLLPGELALGLGMACGFWRWARARQLPLRQDALNLALATWIICGAVRLPFDFRIYGVVALRDFAMVYYIGFFFLGQAWGEIEANRQWLLRCITVGLALATPVCIAFVWWPQWFMTHLLVGGIPLIFVKSDVAGGFMAGAAIWFAERFIRSRRAGWVALSALALFGVGISNSRAALVALAVGLGWLVVLRAWKILAVIGTLFAIGLVGLLLQAGLTSRSFTQTPLYRIYESAASIVDVGSARTYQSTDLDDKPDNNQFRLVWWSAVIGETWQQGRFFGLGFGHDLAADFLRVYYADAIEDFSARSPHNFALSTFGRTGLAGLLLLTICLIAIGAKTWRASRRLPDGRDSPPTLSLWLFVWIVFSSACFGVVLEGPMGAVVFWTVLGLANAMLETPAELVTALPDSRDDAPLNNRTRRDEVVLTP